LYGLLFAVFQAECANYSDFWEVSRQIIAPPANPTCYVDEYQHDSGAISEIKQEIKPFLPQGLIFCTCGIFL